MNTTATATASNSSTTGASTAANLSDNLGRKKVVYVVSQELIKVGAVLVFCYFGCVLLHSLSDEILSLVIPIVSDLV